MTIGDMASLQRGDVVIETQGDNRGHTMIVTQRLDGLGARTSYSVAHCPGPNDDTREELLSNVCGQDIQDAKMFAWRRSNNWNDNNVANRAADLALYWSTAHHTLYGDVPAANVPNASRARGVARLYDHGHGQPPKFGFDALFRVFKWANRYNDGNTFSANRGTTCCSFVMACHQTAALIECLHNNGAYIQTGFEQLRDIRNPKVHHQVNAPQKALRDVSNVGSTVSIFNAWDANPYGADRMWEHVLRDINLEYGWGNDFYGPSLDDVLSSAMKLDAKFTYTLVLKLQLTLGQSGWLAR